LMQKELHARFPPCTSGVPDSFGPLCRPRAKRSGSCSHARITAASSHGGGQVYWAICVPPPMFGFLRWQLIRRDDNCLQPVLRKVLRIESHEEV
jgi:hypothetical protein